ncbi:MAG TPA: IS1595 family transposase [Candidatus Limnocylindrales bacterium]|nr:IS1595 family transposase [Candidatus Limnocylindrales bacterium]
MNKTLKQDDSSMNICKLVEEFNSEQKCREYLEGLRWPHGVECPRCKSKEIARVKERDQFNCNACQYQFSVTSGTIFHDSHLSLWKWFLATYMMLEAKKGVSALQLKRTLAVSYKTAWYLCHRIRAALRDDALNTLCGIVEADETYIGGKARGFGSGYKRNKLIVAGAVQREGPARLEVVPSNHRAVLHDFVRRHAAPGIKALYTDERQAYRGALKKGVPHRTVNHSHDEWVNGNVHTNTVESIWSLLKRSIIGAYHKVSVKHLDAYLDELEFRYNNRKNEWAFRDALLKLVSAEKLTYEQLTNGAKKETSDGVKNAPRNPAALSQKSD